MGERMRGRAGQEALKRRRVMHPMCAHCAERGITRATVEIDHVVPLALGGEDVDENTQGLCLPCHAVKTALEDASAGGAANHPAWLRPASCRLTIVTGPPCAGKSTLVANEAGRLDMVVDLDDLAARIDPSFANGRRWTSELLNRAVRARNSLLGSLSTLPPRSAAWFIVGAPSVAEREWWRGKLQPADWRHLDPGRLECERRALRTRGIESVPMVAQWYVAARAPWSPDKPRTKRLAIGPDGYPVEDGR